jgi:hypothetical protein
MKKEMYFAVTEADNGMSVGTICAKTDKELNKGLEAATREHFDNLLLHLPDIHRCDYEYGNIKTFDIHDNNDFVATIIICETWLY